MISPDDFVIWKTHPITTAVLKWITEARDGLRDSWMAMSWETGDSDPVVLAQARGGASMANDILALEAKDLNEESDDVAAG